MKLFKREPRKALVFRLPANVSPEQLVVLPGNVLTVEGWFRLRYGYDGIIDVIPLFDLPTPQKGGTA